MSKKLSSREKILKSACKLFSQKGFQQTTIRDICADSKSYQISVNYYFGSKENLFKEAILKSYEYTGLANIEQIVEGYAPQEQLYKILKTRIGLNFAQDEKSWFFNILSKEFNVNTELISSLVPQTFTRFMEVLKNVFRKIKPDAADFEIEYSCFLFSSQSFFLTINSFARKKLFSSEIPPEEEIEKLAKKCAITLLRDLKNLIRS